MYYGNIKKYDVADGEGVRVTLFVSGCRVHCEGCFQPQTQDFHYGNLYTKETEQAVIDALRNIHIQGLTLLGGEPFEPENQEVIVTLLRRVKEELPEKDIWCWTGYVYDQDLTPGGRKHTEFTDEILSYVDILVDGPFMLQKRNLALSFRGSENQRVINMKETLKQGKVVKYIEDGQ
ncbi:MAG: anaerobic ribonucleoside-triphosphate reductase activating protein [Solobacterium sp.]|nr:anaerobic ribonucleoside-triphosphate reductase activating protein [Solobacterium sp.]